MENVEVDSLARLASRLEDGALSQVPIEILAEPSTKGSTDHVMSIDPPLSWIDPIFEFLERIRMRLEGSSTKLTSIQS